MFIAGCGTSESNYRATALALPYHEFDQAYGDGWRSVFERGEGLAAVALIEDYLDRHTELTFSQRKFLHLHAGQILALEGKNDRAVRHLDAAMSHQKSPELWPEWDDFITATKAFLMHDRTSLVAARERLAAANAPRLKMADRLLEKFGHSYADVIWWIRVCPSVAIPKDAPARQSAAATMLAKAFGCAVTIAETNPPPCCIWLELRPFSPNAVPNGYVIIHSAEGTIITASDSGWMDDAVQRFIKSSRDTNGYWEGGPVRCVVELRSESESASTQMTPPNTNRLQARPGPRRGSKSNTIGPACLSRSRPLHVLVMHKLLHSSALGLLLTFASITHATDAKLRANAVLSFDFPDLLDTLMTVSSGEKRP
jgi:hypothetical protein